MRSQIDDLKKLPQHITVLFLAANPKDTGRLRLDEEARDILEMIRKSDYRDTITFETRLAVRTFDLLQAINEVNPDIIHFSGHGSKDGKLVFENRNGETKLVSKEAMVQTISTVTDRVRFMFFNACFSSEQAEEIVEYVDAAIGMTDSIGDEAARVFASNFYSAVGFEKNIKVAYEQARAALIWDLAQDMLDNLPGRRRKKPKKQQRLTAVQSGLLQGFVPIRPEWKTISHAHLWSATARAMGEYRSEGTSSTGKNKSGADDAPESEE